MAKIVTEDKHYTDIAATIRKHTGTASTYYPDEMAKGVDRVYEKGVDAGHAEMGVKIGGDIDDMINTLAMINEGGIS